MRWIPRSGFIPLLLVVGFCATYAGSLNTLFMGDETFAYFHPTLWMKENPANFLPWNYHPKMTFGHPPLIYLIFSSALRVWEDIAMVRGLNVFLSASGIVGAWLIGRRLRDEKLAALLALLYMSHFIVWQTANMILVDNLFLALFTFWLYFILQKNKSAILATGIALVLLRETFAICAFSFFLKEVWELKRGRKSEIFFPILIPGLLSGAWFLLLYFSGGHVTAYYNNTGFSFKWEFISRNLKLLSYNNFIQSGWLLFPASVALFSLIKSTQMKGLVRELWPLLLIAVLFFFGLTPIENSINRYQLVGLFSLGVFSLTILYDLVPYKVTALLVVSLFIHNYILKNDFIDHYERSSTAPPRSFYACAKELRAWDPAATVNILDYELVYLVKHLPVFTEFKLETYPHRMKIINRFRTNLEEDFDYFVLVKNTNGYLNNYMKKVLARPDMKLIEPAGTSSCMIFRKN